MKREEIEHLAALARIKLTEEELTSLETNLSSIVDYVSVVSEIAADEADQEPKVGAVYNVFREDKVTNQCGEYTKDIMTEMPHTEGDFMSVKKILDNE